MGKFTVLGFYPDNGQRWAEAVDAASPADAERRVPEDVHVVGVLAGAHSTVDEHTHVRAGGE